VAVLGTGRMGVAMARSLSRNGFPLVLYNRSAARATTLASELGGHLASTAATPADAVARADVAISMVSDEAAVSQLYHGAGGVLEGIQPGAVLLEMSTVPPHVVRGLEPAVRTRGGAILDAPVSGSVTLAEAGTLTIMAGGESADLERVRPVLEGMAARIFHMGGLGTGATIKLAVNAVIFALNQSLAESLVLAERAGVDRATAYSVFASSAIAAPYTQYKQAAFVDPAGTPVAFTLGLAAKDLDLIMGLAEAVGARLPQTATNRAAIQEAAAAEGANADLSAIASWLRDHPAEG
jgi:3-hydroxyisobutyrate dehydrogenase-like beta-hydroxyacid dehydrogenase